jgi:hypothetical protein
MQLTPYENLLNSINSINKTYTFPGHLNKKELTHLTLLFTTPPHITYNPHNNTTYITTI